MRFFILFVISVVVCCSCGGKQKQAPAVNELTLQTGFINHQLDTIFKKLKDVHDQTQVSIALIDNGEIQYYGVKKENDTLRNFQNQNHFFEIGSISKIITSTILATYVDEGKLNQQDKINSYFKFPFRDNQEFTFEELANHTSGLPRLPSNMQLAAMLSPKNPYKDYSDEKLNQYLSESLSLESAKGTKVSYSNLGVGLLGYSLRQYSGLSYEALARTIFDKFEMKQSTTIKSNIADKLVGGLDRSGEVTSNWDMSALIGAGGVYSSVAELSQFALAHFDSTNTELTLTRTQTFSESDSRGVGLGWFIIKRKSGEIWYWHNGATGGYTSCMVIDPVKKNGVIILSNISAYYQPSGVVDGLCFSLMRTLK